MKKITRRKFIKFLGLFGIFLFIPKIKLRIKGKRVTKSELRKKHKLAG
ncbi:MAG: hypothetical protein Q7J55_04400 [bacterium]|nr:hypothetical protein [bacterium]